jgi:hypothetical protein
VSFTALAAGLCRLACDGSAAVTTSRSSTGRPGCRCDQRCDRPGSPGASACHVPCWGLYSAGPRPTADGFPPRGPGRPQPGSGGSGCRPSLPLAGGTAPRPTLTQGASASLCLYQTGPDRPGAHRRAQGNRDPAVGTCRDPLRPRGPAAQRQGFVAPRRRVAPDVETATATSSAPQPARRRRLDPHNTIAQTFAVLVAHRATWMVLPGSWNT